MKVLSFVKTAAVAALMLVGASFAAPAQAASGTWSDIAYGPAIYQSRWQYNSGWMAAPRSIPTRATVSSVYWSVNFINYIPANQYVYINSGPTYWGPIGLRGSASLGFGVSAKQSFRFSFMNTSWPVRVFRRPVYTGDHQLVINYNY
ncbi:MAG: hypothetical protein JKY92_01285 [Magnetovibrio sp.]|nr:hypothetical protein [Magnetovibrio sp.]